MSQARMLELLTEFRRYGWAIANGDEMYEVTEGYISWILVNPDQAGQVELRFITDDGLGNPSRDLRDIQVCGDSRRNHALHFSKIKSEEWKRDLKAFVRDVCECVSNEQS